MKTRPFSWDEAIFFLQSSVFLRPFLLRERSWKHPLVMKAKAMGLKKKNQARAPHEQEHSPDETVFRPECCSQDECSSQEASCGKRGLFEAMRSASPFFA